MDGFILNANLFDGNLSAVSPWTLVGGVKDDLWGFGVGTHDWFGCCEVAGAAFHRGRMWFCSCEMSLNRRNTVMLIVREL